MSTSASAPGVLAAIGDMRWLRGHVSTFLIGIVLLILVNLAAGNENLWSVTATGIWLILLLVHGIVVLIARLTAELVADAEEEEIVLLPVKDAVIVNQAPDIGATWTTPEETPPVEQSETVSWQIATDAAQHRKQQEDGTE